MNNNQSEQTLDNENTMGFWEHLGELRVRLFRSCIFIVIAFVLAFIFSDHIYNYLAKPMRDALSEKGLETSFYYSQVMAPILTKMSLSFIFAIFISAPVFIYQIWAFISPGLYKQEKSFILPLLLSTPLLFILGVAFARYVMFPLAWRFSLSFVQDANASQIGLTPLYDYSRYFTDSLRFIMAFGFCFELPVLILLLVKSNLVAIETLKKMRRYAILIAFILGGILTPADFISQFLLAIPLILLFEVSILVGSKVAPKQYND